MDNSGIYCIYFDQHPDEYYIGRSVNLLVRMQDHKSALLAKRHVNNKLQNYYNKYGMPNFEVLEHASPDILPQLEADYILEFNSFNHGLNLTTGGEGGGYGEGNTAAKYTEQQYLLALRLLADTNLSCSDIAINTGLSRSVVKNISNGAGHAYLNTIDPDAYSKVVNKKYTRDNSAASKGITYPAIKSPTGQEFKVENIHKFCVEHDLQPQNLHKVLTKQRKSHKGWRLA